MHWELAAAAQSKAASVSRALARSRQHRDGRAAHSGTRRSLLLRRRAGSRGLLLGFTALQHTPLRLRFVSLRTAAKRALEICDSPVCRSIEILVIEFRGATTMR